MKILLVQFGLGPIGLDTIALAGGKSWGEVVGAVDCDPSKAGRDLAELSGNESLRGRRVASGLEELLREAKPDCILHTAVSSVARAFPQIAPMVQAGINVVSSCEELVYPQLRHPELAAELDALARKHEVRVLGTGVNPGFVMDSLPLCLTGVSRSIRAIHVQRVVNASTRREPLQRKIGSGQPPADFEKRLRAGEAGHAGLRESLALIAHGLGWKLDAVAEQCEALVADRPIQTRFLQVAEGRTCGIHQRLEARRAGRVCLTLDLVMRLEAQDPHDAIQIEGEPPIQVVIPGGVAGDTATAAALVNAVPRLLETGPGLRLLTDLPLPHWV